MYDEGLRWVELADRLGLVDLWDVILGGAGHDAWGEDSGPSRFYKSNHQAPWNSEVKRIAKVPVVGVGRFTDPDEMVRVIKSGQLDIIGCARPSIADPWLPRKIDEGRVEDICECIGCNVCVSRFNLNSTIICTQNPTAMEEYRRGWHPGKICRDRAPVAGAGGRCRTLRHGMRPGAGRCGATRSTWSRQRRRSADICAMSSSCRGSPNGTGSSPIREQQLSRMANVADHARRRQGLGRRDP